MEPKTYLNRFRIVTGQSGLPVRVTGGAGERTYKAEDITSGEEVALELVPAFGLRPEVLHELEAEAVAAKQLNHINIPKLYDFGFENDHLVYASELFDGTTTEAWVTAHGPMPVGAALRVAQQVVGALGAATFHGILHHAINPRNVMIVPGQTTEGEWPLIKVLNFVGVAPEISTTDSGSLGAAYFASPEQRQNRNVDFRSEIYSLGKTLSFLLTGSPPADGRENIQSASGVPGAVKHLIAQMVATDPAARPLDPLAFQRHIQDLLAQVDRRDHVATKLGMAPAAATVAKARTPRTFPTKPLALAALVLTIATIAGLLLATGLRSGRDLAGNEEPLGVPVGVPEAPVATAASQEPAALASVTSSAPASNAGDSTAREIATNATNPPVITSDPAPSPVDNAAPSIGPPASAEPLPQIASNDLPAAAEPTEPAPAPLAPAIRRDAVEPAAVASSSATAPAATEPIAPAEGPDETQVQPPAPSGQTADRYAEAPAAADQPTAPAVARSSSSTTPETVRRKNESTVVASASTPVPKKTKSVARAGNRAKKNLQVADAHSAMPPVPRGAVRAEFLGTTADGNLVFGLPSSQRGYVAPGESRTRRSRRVINQPPPDLEVLPALPPVLPALPPDDEE